MTKTIGNIDYNHPYWNNLITFFDNLLIELPFHNTLNQALSNINILDQDTVNVMFSNGVEDICDSFIDYLNFKTEQHFQISNEKGIKAILKNLIMFQINLTPHMVNNFTKILHHKFLMTSPLKKIHRFYVLIDHLWYLAGDTSTDYNYYSKRFLLSNIYSEVILYAHSDMSENFQDTEIYLIKCFDKIKIIEKLKKQLPNIEKVEQNITSFFSQIRYK